MTGIITAYGGEVFEADRIRANSVCPRSAVILVALAPRIRDVGARADSQLRHAPVHVWYDVFQDYTLQLYADLVGVRWITHIRVAFEEHFSREPSCLEVHKSFRCRREVDSMA